MKISDAIKQLEDLKKEHGDLEIVGGYVSDDTPPTQFIAVDEDGCACNFCKTKAVGVFIE